MALQGCLRFCFFCSPMVFKIGRILHCLDFSNKIPHSDYICFPLSLWRAVTGVPFTLSAESPLSDYLCFPLSSWRAVTGVPFTLSAESPLSDYLCFPLCLWRAVIGLPFTLSAESLVGGIPSVGLPLFSNKFMARCHWPSLCSVG